MYRNAERASELLKAMGNESRLMILCRLLHGERTVTELVDLVGLSQSALSQHLAILREHGLVKTRREARSIFYALSGPESEAIIATLYQLYGAKGDSGASCPAAEAQPAR